MFKAITNVTVKTIDSLAETVILTSETVQGAAVLTRNAIWNEVVEADKEAALDTAGIDALIASRSKRK